LYEVRSSTHIQHGLEVYCEEREAFELVHSHYGGFALGVFLVPFVVHAIGRGDALRLRGIHTLDDRCWFGCSHVGNDAPFLVDKFLSFRRGLRRSVVAECSAICLWC